MKKQMIYPQIAIDSTVRFGKPVIDGTRVPVEVIIGKLASAMTVEEVMQEYELSKKQVLAALQYATHVVASEHISLT